MKKYFFLILFFICTPIILTNGASALNGNDFPHGRIIDDAVFRNKSSMTVQQIQTFLESKVNGGACDRWRPTYNQNYQPPYTCLFEFQQNPSTGQNNYGQFNPDGSPASIPGGQSAAQIIWQAAQDFNINPQVLIVLLQKEQGLVTDNWPWTIQYSKAAGYNCPDTAPCNPATADFSKQVRGAAWSFNFYIENLDRYWYGIGSNDILYNPNTACGRKTINIVNAATVALYLYTPYTPNQAALDNLYGTGDSCSAYGNRNFWRFFNDWFGSTHAPDYSWQWVDQKIYTNESKTEEINSYSQNLNPLDRYFVVLTVRNTGNTAWNNSDVRIGLTTPSLSPLYDNAWPAPTRPAILKEAAVNPGEIGTFEFWIKTPVEAGNYKQYLGVVREGVAWMVNNQGVHINASIPTAQFSWQWVSQSMFTDETKTTSINPYANPILPNERYYVTVKARNTGNTKWVQGPVRIANTSPADTRGKLYDGTWLGQGRIASLKEAAVNPGEIGTFEFWIKTPTGGGVHLEYFGLVYEGIAWLSNNQGTHIYARVPTAQFSWQWVSQSMFTDETKATSINPFTQNLMPGQRYYVTVKARNTGNTKWVQGPVRIANTSPADTRGKLYDGTWLGQGRIASLKEAAVNPGEIGTFEFWILAPMTNGVTKEYLAVVHEGTAWMTNNQGVHIYANVP